MMSGNVLVAFLSGLAALGLATARIELPAELDASAEHLPVSGFGGRNKGTFEFAGYHGEFTRGESRLGIFDPLFVANRGKSSFTLQRAGSDYAVSGTCQMKKNAVTIGIVTLDPKKLSYVCDIRSSGTAQTATLVLGQPKAKGFKERFLAKDLRRGELQLNGHYLTMESVHNYKGTSLGSQSPVGFLLMQGDRVVAALELTDVNPTIILAPELTADLRESVLTGALALAVLRDPANSALEEMADLDD